MRIGRSVAVPAATGVAALTLMMMFGSGSALGSPVEEEQAETALIGQLVFVPGDASGPDADAVEAARESGGFRTTVDIPAGLDESEEIALIEDAVSEVTSSTHGPGKDEMSTDATNTVTGSCGWSSVTLQDAFGTHVGYYQARVGLNRPGTTYTMNEHVWDPALFDFSSWSWTDSGSFGGGTSWSDDFTFNVDSSTTYSAELDGEVYVGNGWCITAGAQVNSVSIS
jgi:hypothetical protein